MGKVMLDMSMSLDGFIAGPNNDDAGLNHWVFGGTIPVEAGGMTFHLISEQSAGVFREFLQNVGAFVLGKQSFRASGADAPFQVPSFVLSHDARPTLNNGKVTFVADGIESALKQARAVAGDKDVYVFGGADTAQQFLKAGLIDEIQIHLVPLLLGEGRRLFEHLGEYLPELERTRVIESSNVTHLRFRVIK
jgi:dihydrofolate reductase